MSYVVVDVESDGPIPVEFSMVCFGAVVFDDRLDRTFHGRTRPISDQFVPEALVDFVVFVRGSGDRALQECNPSTGSPVDCESIPSRFELTAGPGFFFGMPPQT